MKLGPRHTAYSLLRTLIVFAVIVAILLWVHFSVPNPPFEEGGGGPGIGLEVNLGTGEEGMGDMQTDIAKNDAVTPPPVQQTEEEAEKLLTDDSEEAESIKQPIVDEKKEKKDKKVEKKVKKKEIQEKPAEKKEIKLPQLNQKAMFRSKQSSNEGTTGKPGDQGNPNGTTGSNIYSGNGTGSGGGTGGGSGTGDGTGVGSGVSFNLDGRQRISLEVPEYNSQDYGRVVVEITVDNNGKVVSAKPGVKGSTTNDEYLLQVAKKAALLSKFSRKPDSPVQKGTITYNFVLQ